ncbi:MAG: glycoside hydrolase family 127 protein [Candidatus Limiplasma sp.]|nr:glycoside hydrolase family 127 protein [Candidatus Limiplasma sp.]
MPTVEAYRRAPLVNPAFVPLADATVQVGDLLGALTQRVLALADISAMTPLDAVLASKLGGYTDLPPVPGLEPAAASLRSNPGGFILLARAVLLTASATQDKAAMLALLTAMRAFLEALPSLPEEALLPLGADALRVTQELYRRTGQPFLLTILERLRSQLPDVSGLMHSFPFLKPFRPEAAAGENAAYHRRMKALATGNLTADALAITALLALYSGSSRDGAAAKTGMASLARYHGAPTGAFAADPYLAGRDPARAVDLPGLCAQVEALADVLACGGDLSWADRLEMLLVNALPDLITDLGVRTLQPANRLTVDDSCQAGAPEPQDTAFLLRALYALRRSVWMAREADEIALLLPMTGGCLTRVGGAPLRLTATATGILEKSVAISVEAKQPVAFQLLVRIPSHAAQAWVSVNGGKPQAAQPGSLFPLRRTFRTGDVVTLRLVNAPRLETGYRGSVSVFCGPTLMALSLPDEEAAWQYALTADTPLAPSEEEGSLCVFAHACDAPGWQAKEGFIPPPPQNISDGPRYELTLLPFAGTTGRIAAFPRAAGNP